MPNFQRFFEVEDRRITVHLSSPTFGPSRISHLQVGFITFAIEGTDSLGVGKKEVASYASSKDSLGQNVACLQISGRANLLKFEFQHSFLASGENQKKIEFACMKLNRSIPAQCLDFVVLFLLTPMTTARAGVDQDLPY